MCSSMGTAAAMASVTTAQTKEAHRIANRTRNLKKEQYRIINENGEVVLTKQGKEHEVVTTVGEKREYLQDAVSIHNHPNGGTLSPADLSDFGYGARQIVAASPEGDYKLTRKGTHYNWRNMQDAMEKAGVTKERSYTELKKEAQERPKIKKLMQQQSNISAEWVKARSEGKSQEHLDKLTEKYNKVNATYKEALAAEMRTLETKPYHDFYKKNAKKYGYIYTFEKK